MPVFRGSRYEGVKFTAIIGKDGKTRKFLHQRDLFTLSQMRNPISFQQFQNGQVIDEIAWLACGQPLLWWLLADVNGIAFALDIEPGAEIAIPLTDLVSRTKIE
jgi:hypothetical protein